MKTTHSFGIDFLIRRCREDSSRAWIYARITVDGDKKEVSIKEQIHVCDWLPKEKEGNFKSYKTTIEYTERYLEFKYKSTTVYLSQVSVEFLTELEFYICSNPIKDWDPCEGNGLAKYLQRFKRIMNWAKELKWIKENPVEKYSCPVKKTKRKKLSIEDLVVLENKTFSDKALWYIQELFLYSCYTGLAFAEVMKLDDSHFEWDTNGVVWCLIYRTKSDELCPVPLLPSAARILNKYRRLRAPGETRIFRRIANQTVNRSLKIIQEACGILTPLTFHVARHMFAKTVALKNGIPLETVQMMMGHTKITTTQIYADVDEEKILGDIDGLEEKLNKRRKLVVAELDRRQREGTMLIGQTVPFYQIPVKEEVNACIKEDVENGLG